MIIEDRVQDNTGNLICVKNSTETRVSIEDNKVYFDDKLGHVDYFQDDTRQYSRQRTLY